MKLFNRPLYRAAGRPVYPYYGGLVQVSLAKFSSREPLDVVSLVAVVPFGGKFSAKRDLCRK